ncbi:MAG: EFR1 family ferrodoxin [Bacteroidales bacterium]|nr:EFR1 family ferrodoxin [Bacteroidales bacterium]
MKTTIYYFSATGNSLHLAQNLNSKIEECKLVSIAKEILHESIESSTERIGFIFPVYAWGAPRIVIDFIKKLIIKNKPYVFAIATCVGIPAKTLIEIQNELKKIGSNLDAGFVVKSECSSLMKKNSLDKIIIGLDKKRKSIKTADDRLNEIVKNIENIEKHNPETSSFVANIFGSKFHSLGLDFFKTADESFIINNECNNCGICVKVCPRQNINLENGKLQFNHNCELCHACIQWCPKFAISHPNFDSNLSQYHHPEIQLNQMLIN